MTQRPDFANIDLHLVKVLFTVISERSVSRAALKLGSTQPQVSAQLKRLRALTGDPLLVRAGTGLVPTEAALALQGPAERLLREADSLFGSARGGGSPVFEPVQSEQVVRIAASDYLDPYFLPGVVARLQREAPRMRIEIQALSEEFDYRRKLASGDVDLVVGNWLQPPAELHLGRLISDEVVCLVSDTHPALTQPAHWNAERYLASDHVAPTPLHPGARGVIDEFLALQGLQRRITVRSSHFSLSPLMVASTRLILTTGRQFCMRHVGRLPVRIVKCPVEFPPLAYYQLWHDRTHAAPALRWVREQVREVAREVAREITPAAAERRSGEPAPGATP